MELNHAIYFYQQFFFNGGSFLAFIVTRMFLCLVGVDELPLSPLFQVAIESGGTNLIYFIMLQPTRE